VAVKLSHENRRNLFQLIPREFGEYFAQLGVKLSRLHPCEEGGCVKFRVHIARFSTQWVTRQRDLIDIRLDRRLRGFESRNSQIINIDRMRPTIQNFFRHQHSRCGRVHHAVSAESARVDVIFNLRMTA
jgi:hypothetical protein